MRARLNGGMKGRLLAFGVAAVSVVLFGCTNAPGSALGPSSPTTESPSLNGVANSQGLLSNVIGGVVGGVTNLVEGAPSYYVCKNNGGPYTGSAAIGPKGGVINFGPHKFTVPAGALSKTVTITATSVAGDTIAAVMQPSGLTFAVPATMSFDLTHCAGTPPVDSTLSVVYVSNDLLSLLNLIPTIVNQTLGQNSLLGSISHFSVYAVAERR